MLTEEQLNAIVSFVTFYGMRILVALLIFFIGKWVAGLIRKWMRKGMEKNKVDPVLIGFLSSIAYYLLMVAVVISAISQLGVKTTSFIAVLGAAGLAVGLALQGSLSNFASGVLIILFRPFKIGDFVEIGGVMGVIDEIGILTTEMHTVDNKGIVMPNSQIMAGHIVNFNKFPTRRLDLKFGISYGDDIDKAKKILTELVENDERCLKDPAPTIAVAEHGDSSVNIVVRPWVKGSDYWDVLFEMHELVKKRFDAEGITIPFPQRDVHIFQESASA